MHIALIHGGMWEGMTAERFWSRPGITAALHAHGVEVTAPQRLPYPTSWKQDLDHVVAQLPHRPMPVIAGSNGCTVAIQLAIQNPDRVSSLLLAWPATCGNDRDADFAKYLATQGATDATIDDVLTGQTLRGVTDSQITALRSIPVAVMFAPAGSPMHQTHTAQQVCRLAHATNLGTFAEPPSPSFPPYLGKFTQTVVSWLTAHT